MGTLHIVATPIGNLKDITLRAMELLSSVEFIACEDTRKTGFLLKSINQMYDISIYHTQEKKSENRVQNGPTLLSYFEGNEQNRMPQILNILKNGKDVALVSDAGTPSVSDPGFKLIRECIKEGIMVESLPGASSVLDALVLSGLPTDKFLFVGFLPKKPVHRKKLLSDVLASQNFVKSTIILYESPFRIIKTLEELQEVFGNIHIVVARELTKVHQEIRRETITDTIAHFTKVTPKGEFVILFNRKED